MANSPLSGKNKGPHSRWSVFNGHTAAIVAGSPVWYSDLSANQVKPPSAGSAAAANGLFAGIACCAIPVRTQGDVINGGYVASARRVIRTRAATTDTWASVAAVSTAYWTIDTVNDAVASSGAAAAASAGAQMMVNAATLASVISAATDSLNTDTVSYGTVSLYIRALG